jgi:hypothetical protein
VLSLGEAYAVLGLGESATYELVLSTKNRLLEKSQDNFERRMEVGSVGAGGWGCLWGLAGKSPTGRQGLACTAAVGPPTDHLISPWAVLLTFLPAPSPRFCPRRCRLRRPTTSSSAASCRPA